MGENLEITRAARSYVDMASLARHGNPYATRMDEAGNAQAGARPQHNTACALFRLPAADVFHVLGTERYDAKRLRLEIVDHHHRVEIECRDHLTRTHDPVAIGQFNLVPVDRRSDGEQRGTGSRRPVSEHGQAYCIIDSRIVSRLDGHDVLRFGARMRQNGKARVCTANIADEHRKLQHNVIMVYRHLSPSLASDQA